jgi:cytoskeletal protein RodZ
MNLLPQDTLFAHCRFRFFPRRITIVLPPPRPRRHPIFKGMSLPLIVGIAALLLPSLALPRNATCAKFTAGQEQSAQPQTQPPPASDQTAPPAAPKSGTTSITPQTPAKTTPSKGKRKSATSNQAPPAAAKKPASHKKKSAATPADGPKKVVVRHGSTADPDVQFAPGMSRGQAYYQKQTTEQLLAGTEANLKTASARQLQPGEQDSVEQIKSLMEQSKLAIVMGDLQRARTLAYKAQLLSNELVKH